MQFLPFDLKIFLITHAMERCSYFPHSPLRRQPLLQYRYRRQYYYHHHCYSDYYYYYHRRVDVDEKEEEDDLDLLPTDRVNISPIPETTTTTTTTTRLMHGDTAISQDYPGGSPPFFKGVVVDIHQSCSESESVMCLELSNPRC
mmetsp:Transcript_20823/g.23283  ORF Transcript_20823/g.23283 Transcript_20823/m.23283 type:complete len:144 (+) Transcript_20823:347-778(+)